MKDKKDLRIIFMGTPEFAVASLDAILKAKYNVVGIVTSLDKPAGRGKKMTMSAVKKYAFEKGLNLLQPENLKDEQFLEQLRELKADLQVVVAFRMLPEAVWKMPEMGTFNLHASLLPQYRGAAPINWAVINGETSTGVTTFMLNKEIDKGKIISKREIRIMPEDNAGSLHDKLMVIGSELVVQTIDTLAQGEPELKIQRNTGDLKGAPKIFKETCRIDWSLPVERINNLIRGLSPLPGAFTLMKVADKETTFKIFIAHTTNIFSQRPAGEILCEDKNMYVCCGDYRLKIEEIQQEGKKRMSVAEFMNGFRFEGEDKFY